MTYNTRYIDDTDVVIDNRNSHTTEIKYKDEPDVIYSVDTRFAAYIALNALENLPEEMITDKVKEAIRALEGYDKLVEFE